MHVEKPIKIEGPKHGRCICSDDYKVINTDITYCKGLSYFYEYYYNGAYGAYYKVYLNGTASCNINKKLFNSHFKILKNEKAVRRASGNSNRPKKHTSRK